MKNDVGNDAAVGGFPRARLHCPGAQEAPILPAGADRYGVQAAAPEGEEGAPPSAAL